MQPLDIFIVISGGFSIVATLPLVYLALRSYRDGRELHRVQLEVAELMTEVPRDPDRDPPRPAGGGERTHPHQGDGRAGRSGDGEAAPPAQSAARGEPGRAVAASMPTRNSETEWLE